MSAWDEYVTNMSKQGAIFSGIYTQEGGQMCAQSEGLNVSPAEVEMIKKCVAKTDSKLEISGNKCVMTRVDEGFVQGKTKEVCYQDQKLLFHCEFSNNYIIIVAMTGAGERQASQIGNRIASYLKSLNC